MLSEDQKRILGYFIEEAKDHLNTIEQGLLNLQTTIEDAEMVNEVFRAAHSVKGGAAMLGLNSIQRTAHRLEDFFKLMKETPLQADRDLESMLLRIFDGLQEQLDQLQGPYGLSDDQAQGILSGLEPVFGETESHLQVLIEQAPAAKAEPAPAARQAAPAPAAATHPETSALHLVFQSDVPALLRDLLGIFKQSDTEVTRQELIQVGRRLKNIGVQFELNPWSELIDLTTGAMGNSQQSFRALAPVIIKELKQAQDLVLKGNSGEIKPSAELLSLVPAEPEPQPMDDDALDVLLADALDDDATEDADLADLFAAAESAESPDDAMADDSWLDQAPQPAAASDVDDLEAAFDSLTAEVLDSGTGGHGARTGGVEVGDAELNSLADLFEGDTGGLEGPWEEQELTSGLGDPDAEPGEAQDLDSDLADLLETASPAGEDAGDNNDFESLFGESFDQALAEDSPANSAPQDDTAQDDILDFSFDTPTPAPSATNGARADVPASAGSGAASAEVGMDDFFAVDDSGSSPQGQTAPVDDDAAVDDDIDEFFEAPAASPTARADEPLFFDDEAVPQETSAETSVLENTAASADQVQPAPGEPSPEGSAVETDVSQDDDLDFLFDAADATVDASEVDGAAAFADLDLEEDIWEGESRAVTDALAPESDLDLSGLDLEEPIPTDGDDSDILPPAELEAEPQLPSSDAAVETGADDSPAAQAEGDDLPNFDDLDDLLNDTELPAPSEAVPAQPEDGDGFEDLEALLDDDAGETAAAEATAQGSPSTPEAADLDEFSDLEKLLEDTDQLGGSSPSRASRRAGSAQVSRRTPRRATTVTDQTMRVSVNHLDILSNLVGELVVNRNSLEQDQERLRQFLDNLLGQVQQLNDVGQRMRDLYERSLLESSLISSRQAIATSGPSNGGHNSHATGATFDALEMDRFTGFHTLSQEMIELIVRVREAASDIEFTIDSSDQITRQFRQVTTQLQEGLNKARMVPFGQTADRLPRAVRDISLKCGKEAQLMVDGRDTLIDKMILERLYDPVTHLVNNAITHGIEAPEDREAQGKSRQGTITIRAFYQGNQTVIYIADDGGGINPEIVKAKALKRGLITPTEARDMSEVEVYDLLFLPGFSTRDKADDYSGRGVGMDVVRTALSEIRGAITIESKLGEGTSFTIRLPLTLSISKALSCVNNQARIAFPMDGVEDMFDVPRERIQTNDQGVSCILWRDTLLPFRPLGDLLQFNRGLGRGRVYGGKGDENVISIVVLRSASTFIGLQVDQVMGEQEIVIKQLEGPVPKPTGIAGATVMGDGRVMPIADVLELIDLATGRVRRDPAPSLWGQAEQEETTATADREEPTVLIVDDSITVRELLSMSFNKVGYRVEQARDGQEAWEKLRSGLPCDLVFCDIEMPRMDGLELLSRLQKDEQLSQIPIAMLTSRGADRHRQMAVDLGASGYFTKPYLEEMLLDAAQRMLNGENMMGAGAEAQPQEA